MLVKVQSSISCFFSLICYQFALPYCGSNAGLPKLNLCYCSDSLVDATIASYLHIQLATFTEQPLRIFMHRLQTGCRGVKFMLQDT
jgi:hypothetical protein